jgi:hypothetical protein
VSLLIHVSHPAIVRRIYHDFQDVNDRWRGQHLASTEIGPAPSKDLAQVYVTVGECDKALDKIEYLLSIPGELPVPLLKIDPVWVPLRSLPRFSALLRKFDIEK